MARTDKSGVKVGAKAVPYARGLAALGNNDGEDSPRSALYAPAMMLMAPEDDPRVAGWLVPGENCTREGYDLVLRGAVDDGTSEQPWGSNTGVRIKRYGKRAGYGESAEHWCGIWLGAVYTDRGCYVPEWYGAVDNWLPYSQPIDRAGLIAAIKKQGDYAKHLIGAAIIYGKRGTSPLQTAEGRSIAVATLKKTGWDGIHIGMVTKAEVNSGAPDGVELLTREANRGYGIVTNVGVAVDQAPSIRHDVIAIHFPRRDPNYVPKKQTIRLVAG
jgi:hypothetical protein